MKDCLDKIKEKIDDCDALVIGAGAGLSTSAGFLYSGERFERYFSDFERKYHFEDMYYGGFRVMELHLAISWAYWSRYIYINRYLDAPKPVYEDLHELVKDKDYFVITTNVDHCFQKAGFDKKRLFYTQGDYGLFQCSKPCHDRTYDNEETVKKMLAAQGFIIGEDRDIRLPEGREATMEIPEELIPHCPVCGEPMMMNLRSDDRFVEDEGWHQAAERYGEFLRRHRHMKTVYLELGVGANTPGIIKYPFWRFVKDDEDASYICINYNDAYAPEEIRDRSLLIEDDIGKILRDLK